ncbi:MAG: hypothetical protein ACREUG_08615 [Steroidobacteraceae bacterium]
MTPPDELFVTIVRTHPGGTLLTPMKPEVRLEYAPQSSHNVRTEESPIMSNSARKLLTVAVATLSIGAFATASLAATKWQNHHPRRAEVNHRLTNQSRRIREERKEGAINGHQADRMHREDRTIRHEERAMARTNNGHVTKAEKRALNQQESQVSRQIGK